MPVTPKVFWKKSKVKTWFIGLAREVLAGEDLPVSESSVATGKKSGYLSRISESLQWSYKPPGRISESLQWNYKPLGRITESLQ